MENRLYKAKYGAWAGNPGGTAPDFARCCKSLYDKYHPGGYQCTRKRGHGPDEAYCKQHDPAAVDARRRAQDAKYNAERNKRRYEWYGRTFYDALKLIAEGHNDARGLAQDVLSKFHEGESK